MNKYLVYFTQYLLLFTIASTVNAETLNANNTADQAAPFPSHCRENETVFINAKMKRIQQQAGDEEIKFVPTGKIMSLCGGDNSKAEPFIAYRYGKPNQVELEKIATTREPFAKYHHVDGRLGRAVVFFNNGRTRYYVQQSLGMGSGIAIDVFQNGKQLARLFSGNDNQYDFRAELDVFDLPSQLAISKTPLDAQMRSPKRITWIKRRYSEIRARLGKMKNTSIDMSGKSTEGGSATAYTNYGSINLVTLAYYGETGKTEYEFYYDNDMAFFVLAQHYHYNAPITLTAEKAEKLLEEEGIQYEPFSDTKTQVEAWRYYFDGDLNIRIQNPERQFVEDHERAKNIYSLSIDIINELKHLLPR